MISVIPSSLIVFSLLTVISFGWGMRASGAAPVRLVHPAAAAMMAKNRIVTLLFIIMVLLSMQKYVK